MTNTENTKTKASDDMRAATDRVESARAAFHAAMRRVDAEYPNNQDANAAEAVAADELRSAFSAQLFASDALARALGIKR